LFRTKHGENPKASMKLIRPFKNEPLMSRLSRYADALGRFINKPGPTFNHFCPGESGSGEWSHFSEDFPCRCGYCKQPSKALISLQQEHQR